MNISIYGCGYVGLVSAACLAEAGNDVLCMDTDERKIAALQQGVLPIYELGLESLAHKNIRAGRLSFTVDAQATVTHGLLQFIAVGTPPDEDGSADLRHVLAVARSIGQHMNESRIIVDKSTVPVGTADLVRTEIQAQLQQRGIRIEFDVVSNPEFLKEGAAIEDFMKPDRIIIGADNARAADSLRTLYAPFNRNHERVMVMDVRSAELTKYAANAMLATKISFMNELANIAERVGADIEQVRLGIGSDPRIGYHFIYPGCGYGGSCFPKDVQALEQTAKQAGHEPHLLHAVEAVNRQQKRVLFGKISNHFKGDLKDKTFALWGLAFKPNTDDMRDAPSRALIEQLWSQGARVQAFDPVAMQEARRIYGERPDFVLCDSAEAALQGADALVIVTEWREFRSPDFADLKATLTQPVIFDGRNLYDPAQMQAAGIHYYGIGRGSHHAVSA
ncbi:MAG: UDP-glucose/GDP-mannose dehydrogenase family protein [Gammaproteobacteria bacterium]|nr:UDP-glucose/GDP-mannose dehydrogenase family protein [Gammaproteobacteria bacterium]